MITDRLAKILREEGLKKGSGDIEKSVASMLKKQFGRISRHTRGSQVTLEVTYPKGTQDDPKSLKALAAKLTADLGKLFPGMQESRVKKTKYDSYKGKVDDGKGTKILVSVHPTWRGPAPRGYLTIHVPKAKKPEAPPKSAAEPLTKRQWSSVLNAMRRGYDNSYAMMVDDAFKPFQRAAKKYGLGDYYDGAVFSYLFGKVKSHNGKLTSQEVDTLNEMKALDA